MGIARPAGKYPPGARSGGVGTKALDLPLGIGARLGAAFAAVAVLAVTANLMVASKVSIQRTTEVVRIPAVVPAPAVTATSEPAAIVQEKELPAPTPVAESPQPAPSRAAQAPPPPPPLPAADGLLRGIESMKAIVQSGAEGAATDYPNLANELDRSAAAYAEGAIAVGEAPPTNFLPTIRSFRQRGEALLKAPESRRALVSDYSSHLDQLNTRVKQALHHTWKFFGHVTRPSLVKVSDSVDALLRPYAHFISSASTDQATYDELLAAESSIAQALSNDRDASSHGDPTPLYAPASADLEAMESALAKLQQLDQQQAEDKRRFAEEAAAVPQIIARLVKAHARPQRPPAAPVEASHEKKSHPRAGTHASSAARGATEHTAGAPAASGDPSAPGPALAASSALTFAQASAHASATPLTTGPQPPTSGQQILLSTETQSNDRDRLMFVASVTGVLLLAIVLIAVATVLSIARPLRRLLAAGEQISRGGAAVPVAPCGIVELNDLALAFHDMSGQLALAQQAAGGEQTELEAKVMERTRELQELAEADPLTRLANRRHFFAMLNSAIDVARHNGRIVGVLFVDIDNFKNMNDSLGHAFGDQALQAIAQRLEDVTRAFGFAARLGGDEFTVVCESAATLEDVRQAGRELVEAFHSPLVLGDRELLISVSVGASAFPDHAADAEALLRAADAALFQAKALGRNQLHLFTPALLEAATAKFSTEQGLRRAIERGEFELAFQPEVNLQSGQTELVEALLRWRMPDGRVALPGEFLPVAEESGLILKINDWVTRKAIETAARWHHGAWPEARVAINVSSRQLFDDGFVERVRGLLTEYRLPARCIEFELTENVLQTGSATINTLRRLRAHGIAIALDDFGTGFSSLSSLELLPLARIKLDRSLISSIDTSARSAAITRAIIAMCQGLGLAITAEGIERPEQLVRLLGYSGLYAQGFLLSYPVSEDELMPVLAGLRAATQSLIRTSVARMADGQLVEDLPLISAAGNTI